MNIEAPAEMIRQMVADGIRAAGIGSGNRSQTVILQVGRRELGRVVYELNKRGDTACRREAGGCQGIVLPEIRTFV